jgi:hypothetical protein
VSEFFVLCIQRKGNILWCALCIWCDSIPVQHFPDILKSSRVHLTPKQRRESKKLVTGTPSMQVGATSSALLHLCWAGVIVRVCVRGGEVRWGVSIIGQYVG